MAASTPGPCSIASTSVLSQNPTANTATKTLETDEHILATCPHAHAMWALLGHSSSTLDLHQPWAIFLAPHLLDDVHTDVVILSPGTFGKRAMLKSSTNAILIRLTSFLE